MTSNVLNYSSLKSPQTQATIKSNIYLTLVRQFWK